MPPLKFVQDLHDKPMRTEPGTLEAGKNEPVDLVIPCFISALRPSYSVTSLWSPYVNVLPECHL